MLIFNKKISSGTSSGISQTNISTFYYNKSGNFCLRVYHESLFDWKFFKMGSVSVKDLIKNVPILQAGWPTLDPPKLSVLRVVLLQSEAFAKRL